jgi:hypothetical protein
VKALAAALLLALAAPALAQDAYTEPRSGVQFPVKRDGMTLLGAGLRIKQIAFVKAKVYAIGLYAADSAWNGALAKYKGQPPSDALYQDLIWGDFPKQLVLRFTRDVGQGRIQSAMREGLQGADPKFTELFVSYFPEVREGQECVLRWAPGGTLETSFAGLNKGPINDKTFAAAVFGVWLRAKPVQDDIKAGLVVRLK